MSFAIQNSVTSPYGDLKSVQHYFDLSIQNSKFHDNFFIYNSVHDLDTA